MVVVPAGVARRLVKDVKGGFEMVSSYLVEEDWQTDSVAGRML